MRKNASNNTDWHNVSDKKTRVVTHLQQVNQRKQRVRVLCLFELRRLLCCVSPGFSKCSAGTATAKQSGTVMPSVVRFVWCDDGSHTCNEHTVASTHSAMRRRHCPCSTTLTVLFSVAPLCRQSPPVAPCEKPPATRPSPTVNYIGARQIQSQNHFE